MHELVLPLVLAVIGDLPYGTSATDTRQFDAAPAFIQAINADARTALVLHVGDIHSGKQSCTQAYDQAILDQWKAFRPPMVYTPGDNEWADCHKIKEGGGSYNAATGAIEHALDSQGQPVDYAGGDPLANLELVRSIFFPRPGQSLGRHPIAVHSQALDYDRAHPTDNRYAENVWFEQSQVLFLTLNMPGGSNNDTDPWYDAPRMSPVQAQEVADRTAANLRWLDTGFAQAQARGDAAVLIAMQADMWNLDDSAPDHIARYQPFIDRIASLTARYGKPVLLINGDSHIYRSDNPLMPGAPCVTESGAATQACDDDAYQHQPHGYHVGNFHRIVVHGGTLPLEWLRLTIRPGVNAADTPTTFGPFSWQRVQPTP